MSRAKGLDQGVALRSPMTSTGPDAVMIMDIPFGLGFMRESAFSPFGSPTAFGHYGAGGSVGFGDVEKELGVAYVMNKMDAIPEPVAAAVRDRVGNLTPSALFASAVAPGGLDGLRTMLREAMRRQRPILEIRIPASNGRLLAEVHREGEVLEQRADDDVMVVRARLDERMIGRLRHAGARIIVTSAAA